MRSVDLRPGPSRAAPRRDVPKPPRQSRRKLLPADHFGANAGRRVAADATKPTPWPPLPTCHGGLRGRRRTSQDVTDVTVLARPPPPRPCRGTLR